MPKLRDLDFPRKTVDPDRLSTIATIDLGLLENIRCGEGQLVLPFEFSPGGVRVSNARARELAERAQGIYSKHN
jgi:hypothetical protein